MFLKFKNCLIFLFVFLILLTNLHCIRKIAPTTPDEQAENAKWKKRLEEYEIEMKNRKPETRVVDPRMLEYKNQIMQQIMDRAK
jgi:hypothetical protein